MARRPPSYWDEEPSYHKGKEKTDKPKTPIKPSQFDEQGNLLFKGAAFTQFMDEAEAYMDTEHSGKTEVELLEEEKRRIFEQTNESLIVDELEGKSEDDATDSLITQLQKQLDAYVTNETLDYFKDVQNTNQIQKLVRTHRQLTATVVAMLQQLQIKLPDRQHWDPETRTYSTTFVEFSENRKFTIDQISKALLLASSTLGASSTELAYLKRQRDEHQKLLVDYQQRFDLALQEKEKLNEDITILHKQVAALEIFECESLSKDFQQFVIVHPEKKRYVAVKDTVHRKQAQESKLESNHFTSSAAMDRMVVVFPSFEAAQLALNSLTKSYSDLFKEYKKKKRKDETLTFRDFYKGPRKIRQYVIREVVLRQNKFLERKYAKKIEG